MSAAEGHPLISPVGDVLVVDDDQGIQTLISAVLGRYGFATDGALNGREAIQKLESRRYNAVVLDLMMEGVNGFDVIEHLERIRPEMRCVVVVSASAMKNLERVEGKSVVRAVLRKPFDITELVRVVRECLG